MAETALQELSGGAHAPREARLSRARGQAHVADHRDPAQEVAQRRTRLGSAVRVDVVVEPEEVVRVVAPLELDEPS